MRRSPRSSAVPLQPAALELLLVFAQSILEYGLLAAVVTAVQSAITSVRDWAVQSPEQVWILAGVVAILVILWGRFRK
jgi:hypothetical protein